MNIMSFLATTILASAAVAKTTVYHDYAGALRGIELSNACVTDTEVKTIQPQSFCTELVDIKVNWPNNKYTAWECKQWEVAHASYPRSFGQSVCSEYETGTDGNLICKKWIQQMNHLPNVIKISTVQENGETSDFPGTVSTHTFPTCP